MKIKTFLLGLIFSFLGIFNYSSAFSFSSEGNVGSSYIPNSITLDSAIDFSSLDYDFSCSSSSCSIIIGGSRANPPYCRIDYFSNRGLVFDPGCIDFSLGTYDIKSIRTASSFSSISFNVGGSSDGLVISDGFSSLSPAIIGLFDTLKEFIPYVLYISIGLLISIIGFIVIKWLLNWFSGNIFGKFK